MAWYSDGTVSVTNGSPVVTGTSTAFVANARSGDAFMGPDGRVYELVNASSNTVLAISPNYMGSTGSGQPYAIAPMQGYVKASADLLRSVVNNYAGILTSIQPWATAETAAIAREELELAENSVLSIDGRVGALILNVENIESLRLTPSTNAAVCTAGYYEAGDGGAGRYVFDADDTTSLDNGFTVIVATDGGRRKLQKSTHYDLRQAGVVFDGITDNTAALNNAITFVKANGGILTGPEGVCITGQQQAGSATKYWGIIGAGKYATEFRHKDGNGTMFVGGSSSTGTFYFSDFTINCMFTEYAHVNSSHGIAITGVSGARGHNLRVENYKGSGILIYDNIYAGNKDNKFFDCEVVGNGVTTDNGMLIANMDDSGFWRCRAEDVLGSPGFGVQLKNQCTDSHMVDCSGKNCVEAVAFGNDSSPATSAEKCSIVNAKSFGCSQAFTALDANNNYIHFSYIDHNNSSSFAFDLLGSSSNNTAVIDVIENIPSNRACVRLQGTGVSNSVDIKQAQNLNSTGYIVDYTGTTGDGNIVNIGKTYNPVMHPNGTRGWGAFGSTAGNAMNSSFYAITEQKTISAGVVTRSNTAARIYQIDTESASASDDLDTISASIIDDGRIITISTISNARDIVVKHATGNIRLNGSIDFTLAASASSVSLEYRHALTAWCEVSRASI